MSAMADDIRFLEDHQLRSLKLDKASGFRAHGLFVGNGSNAVEVAVADADEAPKAGALRQAWKKRKGNRAAPLLFVVRHPEGVVVCGATGENPPLYTADDVDVVERICREALRLQDRHSVLHFLAQALPALETPLAGLSNHGFVALHELEQGVPNRPDWDDAGRKAAAVRGTRAEELLGALGYTIKKMDNNTKLLLDGKRRVALAVLVEEGESPEASTKRLNDLSPVSFALARADSESLRWVILVQGNRVRLYSTNVEDGVGRRGRTETYIECQTSLLSNQNLPYVWLLFSAEAIAPEGTLTQILGNSRRFAGGLADKLRERIYSSVVPTLARGVADAKKIQSPTADQLVFAYEMAMTILFRLLFIAYAEDRDLLPYSSNESYRARSLKRKAHELVELVATGRPIAVGSSSHWDEVSLLWEAVNKGNSEWGVPAYNGGLFTDNESVSPIGSEIANITLSNEVFELALRDLLVIETMEGVPGAVDFRSLGVREFGTIYEGLLESELAVANTDLTLSSKGTYVPADRKSVV